MKLTLSHQKNPAVGWDINAAAVAEKDERVAHAQIIVGDFPEYDENFDPPLSNWQKQLTQQGQFPGDNRVQLTITDDKGQDTAAEDEWD
jgi:hypothetical protein